MMLVYYTALVFGYTIHGEPVSVTFWLESYKQCLEAMSELEGMYDYIADQVSDHRIFMWCDQSSIPSNEQIKPMPRPNA